MPFETDQEIYQFGGKLLKLWHESKCTKTRMDVNVFLPPVALSETNKVPVLLYLSGLTCTPNNASEKSFLQYFASKYGFAVIFPDTSPRGASIKGEDDSYDFGSGAGFYVDATQDPWMNNYKMFSYIHGELQNELANQFKTLDFCNISITGHSMGGFGALSGFFKNPGKYKSVSAFAPIANPVESAWGKKAFAGYLGDDRASWEEYDPVCLVKKYAYDNQPDILIHQGSKDPFYYKDFQLKPENFARAVENSNYKGKVHLNIVEGYDHSYFFISSFVEHHAAFHAKYLGIAE